MDNANINKLLHTMKEVRELGGEISREGKTELSSRYVALKEYRQAEADLTASGINQLEMEETHLTEMLKVYTTVERYSAKVLQMMGEVIGIIRDEAVGDYRDFLSLN